jgi:hypothetical protein
VGRPVERGVHVIIGSSGINATIPPARLEPSGRLFRSITFDRRSETGPPIFYNIRYAILLLMEPSPHKGKVEAKKAFCFGQI